MDELLREKEYASLRHCSVRTVQRERVAGHGCQFVRLGSRIFYRKSDITAFIASRVHGSTSEYVGGK